MILERLDQVSNRLREGSHGGQPPSFDSARYTQGDQIERGFNRRKQFRAVATRYDKLGSHWQATNDLVEVIDWIRPTSDKTRSRSADTP
ncbi:Transposase DDE domain-containing protein [Streptoalloteichus tenebrarius]|uniref:Transposase DDE domain-containing protein n=1 Tax=Streptoalloteichus tenebrarius (strain ATCC 17920 / DSM 40477 / JCM 4838 / CBS 697.72 / NBRC 16177 / NCIMB 11028 / NRRL B-12390 / A12253. 1 / ISP 5477) TaxID=1933 RepID=A0ABT1HT49_STRSD|nr:hypothetical protein [Streptoalloteichus tenebrarius]MCP2258679.1 Transposase DDE domain-containing protein [Streptoalloteichus tenebrarius]BFF02824.1 hypothetical protein GCM10020241_44990 [Streptoalloteichus tenebrarius]